MTKKETKFQKPVWYVQNYFKAKEKYKAENV